MRNRRGKCLFGCLECVGKEMLKLVCESTKPKFRVFARFSWQPNRKLGFYDYLVIY